MDDVIIVGAMVVIAIWGNLFLSIALDFRRYWAGVRIALALVFIVLAISLLHYIGPVALANSAMTFAAIVFLYVYLIFEAGVFLLCAQIKGQREKIYSILLRSGSFLVLVRVILPIIQ